MGGLKKETTKVLNTDTKTATKQKTTIGTYAAMLAFIAGGGFYFYTALFAEPEMTATTAKSVVEVDSTKTREPAQTVAKTDELSGSAKMMLTHFDKQKMQVFINGTKSDVDLLNSVMVPVGAPFTVRIQIEGRKHFIKEMNLGNNSTFEVEIPETPAIAYGYVYTSSECSAKGELRFEIFGEKRVSPVPMKQRVWCGASS